MHKSRHITLKFRRINDKINLNIKRQKKIIQNIKKDWHTSNIIDIKLVSGIQVTCVYF